MGNLINKNKTSLIHGSISGATRLSILLMGIFVVLITSCKDSIVEKPSFNPDQPIELTKFMPDSGRVTEMVLLDGKNFGSDPSIIKVFFNKKEAKVISSIGTRILALVPRLPGDICTITVQVGEQKKEYTDTFRYKVAASVTTLAGNGTRSPIFDQGLAKAQLGPVYIGADKDFNIFVTDVTNTLLRLDVATNAMQVIATSSNGFTHRCPPIANPETNVLQIGWEGGNRDRFLFLDPKEGWAPKIKTIREWKTNGFQLPTQNGSDSGSPDAHNFILLCQDDGYFYTRYTSGLIARIDPRTWKAEAMGMTPSGIVYCAAMHPINKKEMWFAYAESGGEKGHSICRLTDITDTITVVNSSGVRLLKSYEKMSGATNGGFRDGPLDQAQFNGPRQVGFDKDGNLFVGDNANHCIRMINTKTMMVETVIGIPGQAGFKDGSKDEALFNSPHGIVVDAEGIIYVSDHINNRIRRIAIE